MSKDELPSISDYDVDRDNLPSYKEFIESREEILPSINDFLKEEVAEETQTIENFDGESFLEVTDVVSAPDWSELVRLINDVRKDIPKVPEIKYYDEELEKILENIDEIRNNIPEVVYYDQDISSLKEEIGQVRSEIPQVPEVKYYEGDIEYLHTKINLIKEDISKLPEVKYYDADVESLKSYIDEVKGSIPKFPDWVNQVNEVPDFSWIGKTFSCIDDDFNKVQGHLDLIKEKIQFEVSDLNEAIEAKGFEFKVDLKNLEENVKETKERIWKELRETSTRIWDHHYEYKDDDRKLKKQILGEYNKLKQKVQEEVKSYNEENSKYQTDLLVKFKFVEEKVENLDIRYYDEEIEGIQEDVNSVKTDVDSVKEDVTSIFKELENIAQEIKKNQEELKENYLLSEPPNEKQRAGGQSDPLTPTGEKFATFKDLEQHYRLFLNRIQVQLSTIGGGGAGFIKDLDDVSFDQTTGNNKLLIYDQANSKWVGIASTSLSGSTALVDLTDVDTSNLGDGRFLRYDASSNDFTFEPVSATNLELIAGDIQSGILTTTSILPATVMSISASTYRSVNYQIQVTEGTNYNMTTINVIHDGTDTYMTEYGTINQPVGIATFSTDISGGSLRLLGYPASTSSTTFKVIFTALQA